MACDNCTAYQRIDAEQQRRDIDAIGDMLIAVFNPD